MAKLDAMLERGYRVAPSTIGAVIASRCCHKYSFLLVAVDTIAVGIYEIIVGIIDRARVALRACVRRRRASICVTFPVLRLTFSGPDGRIGIRIIRTGIDPAIASGFTVLR